MKKSTKGVLAAAAAGVLLLGGAGSLAYWSATGSGDAGTIASGSLTLSAVDCSDPWVEGGVTITTIVPGDTITKECTATLTLVGDHIGATVALDDSSVDAVEAAFNDEVAITSTLTEPAAAITDPGTYDVTVTLSAAFDGPGATNDSQSVTETLDGLELTATQTHNS
ncbi:alternate-type signal peptide domain-containing protein [Aeromicrobium sp. UC242_57]|uniref:alternate-type signal peptide domain-containing protein n=1 Tax=Aeromicrobium sp. UC242_57 TaxID=3374624 RepID=UPI0037B60B1D